MNRPVLILFLSILIFGCNTRDALESEYAEQLVRYFQELHNVKLEKKENIILVPLDGCSPCLEELLSRLSNAEVDATLLIVGQADNDLIYNTSSELEERYTSLKDISNEFRRYRTNVHGPSLIQIIESDEIYVSKIDSENVNEVITSLH